MSRPLKPWMENICYPGTHWLLYTDDHVHDYVARVDLRPWDNGLYFWEAFMYQESKRQYGLCETLEEAQKKATQVILADEVIRGSLMQGNLFKE